MLDVDLDEDNDAFEWVRFMATGSEGWEIQVKKLWWLQYDININMVVAELHKMVTEQ